MKHCSKCKMCFNISKIPTFLPYDYVTMEPQQVFCLF